MEKCNELFKEGRKLLEGQIVSMYVIFVLTSNFSWPGFVLLKILCSVSC